MAVRRKLTPDAQRYAVTAQAMWDTPQEVAEAIKEKFGIEVTPQAVEFYDPTKAAGHSLSKKWRELFEKAREEFKSRTADIAIANRAYRLKRLDRLERQMANRGNVGMTLAILQQAANESGNGKGDDGAGGNSGGGVHIHFDGDDARA